METFSNVNAQPQPHLQLSSLPSHLRPSFPLPISSISFKTSNRPRPSRSTISFRIQPSSSSPFPVSNSNSSSPKCKTQSNPFPPLFSLLKTPLCITVAAAAVFFSRFPHKPLFSLAVSVPTVEKTATTDSTTSTTDAVSDEDNEKALEEYVASHPDDIQGLKSLMESKLKSKKLQEAIEVVHKLIDLQPDEIEWPMLRAHIYVYAGESEQAKASFEEIISKDQSKVEAFHGLIMAVSQGSEDRKELEEVMRRVELAMQNCKKEKRADDVRDLKLLIAQIWVIEGKYPEALKVYEELVREEPRDFRPYLCQGIIYTLLRKKDEAEKYFVKYKRLVPKGHPYADYFDENVLATKLWSQTADNQGMAANGMKI